MNAELKAKLEKLAVKNCWSDEEGFSAHDNSGGQTDDAYYGGCSDGEILLARELLKEFGTT